MLLSTEPATKMTTATIVKKLLMYCALAFGSLALLVLALVVSRRAHVEISFRWVCLALFTACLIVFIVRQYRTAWTSIPFWMTLGLLVIVHLAVMVPVLRRFDEFKPVWFAVLMVLEVYAFGLIYDTLCLVVPKHRASRKR